VSGGDTLTVLNSRDVKLRPWRNADTQKWRVETRDGKFGFRNISSGSLLGVNGGGWVGAGTYELQDWEKFSLIPVVDGYRFTVDRWMGLTSLPLIRSGQQDYLEVPGFLGLVFGSPVTIAISSIDD
jgi:hypothetical protein